MFRPETGDNAVRRRSANSADLSDAALQATTMGWPVAEGWYKTAADCMENFLSFAMRRQVT
jgi:hypothetical protein